MNSARKVVFSNTLTEAPWGTCTAAEIATGNAAANVKKLKALPGKSLVLWGSISVAQALMRENLVDELHLHICPALTAGGTRLFSTDLRTADLILVENRPLSTGVVLLKYRL